MVEVIMKTTRIVMRGAGETENFIVNKDLRQGDARTISHLITWQWTVYNR